MFAHVATFELRYQLRSPVFWVGCAIFFLLTFGSVTVDQIQIGSGGNVKVNAPFAILQTLAIMGLFAVFVHVALVAGAVIRDDETGFAPLIRSTRLSKGAYLGGRFVGAATAAFGVLACMPLAVALGSLMPWLDPAEVGPFVPAHYLWSLFVFALPTMLIVAAGCFALATLTRSMMWSYVAAVAVLVGYFVSRGLLRDPQYDTWAALSDPFGLSALGITVRYWTATERNTMLPPLAGLLLANRLLWSGIALALFAFAAWRFRFAEPGAGLAQLWALTRHDMAFVFRSPAFFVLLAIGVLNAGASAWFTGEWYGSGSYPATRLMVQAIQGAFTIMPLIIAIYYGGELVWRDRERRMHEIVDSTAAPDWTHLLPKIAAIALVLAASGAVAVLTGMAVQLAKGWTQLQPLAYLGWLWWPMVVVALQLAVLSVFVQVLVPQKFIGWGVMLLQLVATIALATAGFEHNLYNFGGTSPVPLSDMNGAGRFWIGAAWFQLYWSAFALLLAVAAWALWRRGTTTALRPRLRHLGRRLRGPAGALAGVAALAWVGSGAWIVHNTNRLNSYVPTPEREKLLGDAERMLLPLEKLPLPRITAVALEVDLYPRQARAVTNGRYTIRNAGNTAIDQLVIQWPDNLKLDRLDLPGAALAQEWGPATARWPVRRYALSPALQPGEERTLAFATTLEERGFPNGAPLTRIVENGSFLDNTEITPVLGIDRRAFLKDRSKRRQQGLEPDLRPAKLEDDSARWRHMLRADSDWVQADIRVTTDADQTPIAPGQTVSDGVKDGRRTVVFKPDAPINHFFSIQSARYQVQRDRLGEIDLAVYFHPGHEFNVDRMLKAMKASIALFSKEFSPYQFKQARILEFPSYADFAQAFANTIPYSENIGFLAKLTDPNKIDIATYVTAHEIAHQWWAHQLIPADQQGATMLVESFAQYSALLVMEQIYGREQMRRFLKYELDRYLRARGGEVVEELPLARVEDQAYIHYYKGSLAMYWLKEVVGVEVVNAALAELLKQYAFKPAPYPNARDFLSILRARAGPQHEALIVDLFETITLWDVKTTDAKATQRPDSRWDVALTVQARKIRADGLGKETEVPMQDEPFDIGAFRIEPGQKGFDAAAVLVMQRVALKSGEQVVNLVVDQKPGWAGIDPYNKRIDRNSSDNGIVVGGD
jgi:ABC-2 type transport system permease protein